MYVVVSYAMATFFMYTIKFPTYTGWSRVQSICCITFLYTTDAPIATDLIILNSFGCLCSAHVFYSLSQYKILHTLASRSLQPYAFYQQSNHKNNFITLPILSYMELLPVCVYFCILHPMPINIYGFYPP